VRQPIEDTHVEAILGIVASLEDRSARTLECRRRDGTTFTSYLRSLHLQDERSIVKLSLWGQRLAEEAGRRLQQGDLLLVTHVTIDRFMGEKGFKASGTRPQLVVIPSRADAPRLLQRAVFQGGEGEGGREEGLGLYRALLARAEALWRWKEVEEMRQAERERQAAARRSTAIAAGGGGGGEGGGGGGGGGRAGLDFEWEWNGGGYDGLMVGREDGEVRGVVHEWRWRNLGVEEGGGGGGRVIVFKLVDSRGMGHVLEFPEGMVGVGHLEYALQKRDALRRDAAEGEGEEEEEEDVQVLVTKVGCVVFGGGMLAPLRTARTCVYVLRMLEDEEGYVDGERRRRTKKRRKKGPVLVKARTVREAWALLHSSLSPSLSPPRPPAPPAPATAQPSQQSQQQQQQQEGEEEPPHLAPGNLLVVVGAVVGVLIPADEGGKEGGREGEEEALPEVGELAAALVKRKPRVGVVGGREGGGGYGVEEENKWVYRDLILRVADPPSSLPSSSSSSPSSSSSAASSVPSSTPSSTPSSSSYLPREELRVRVTDSGLQSLVGHIPASRLIEEAETETDREGGREGGKKRPKTPPTTAPPFFYTKWVRRALLSLASSSNPPWKVTTRVLAVGEGREGGTEREEEGGGGGGGGGVSMSPLTEQQQQQIKAELLLLRAVVAPPLSGEQEEGEEKEG